MPGHWFDGSANGEVPTPTAAVFERILCDAVAVGIRDREEGRCRHRLMERNRETARAHAGSRRRVDLQVSGRESR